MTKRKLRQVRKVKVYVLYCAVLCVAFGIAALAGMKNEEILQTNDTEDIIKEVTEHKTEIPKESVVTFVPTPTDEPNKEPQNTLEPPFDEIPIDLSQEDLQGFVYRKISGESKASRGYFPIEVQMYTYIICQQYGFDYEIVFALIEKESHCRWDAIGDDGVSFGYMQIYEKWHTESMERLGCTDLLNPYQNILVGIDYLARLQEQYEAIEDVLAAYNYEPSGAKKHLWSNGIHWYSYNESIVSRASELKKEARKHE